MLGVAKLHSRILFYGRNIPQFIYDALDEHLDSFQFLATMSSAAINIFVHAFL